jgi:YVTN family beta-propeller protein
MSALRAATVLVLALSLAPAAATQVGSGRPKLSHRGAIPLPPTTNKFVNWETPQVHPLDLSPDESRLLALNTADDRLLIYDASASTPNLLAAVPVGVDPVSVRARTNSEAWVVNHISDSISIVDLPTARVMMTLQTDDEPTDVVFVPSRQRAFVTCSQANTVLVFDLTNLTAAPTRLEIEGEDPRALSVSPDESTVYAAIFESGNGTTLVGGGSTEGAPFPPNATGEASGPYGGVTPSPNQGTAFVPPMNPANPPPPAVSMIVKRTLQGAWLDENGGDWTNMISGQQARLSGRPPGWDLLDHDVAVIDSDDLSLSYVDGLMNIVMALDVNPVTGQLSVVGTDATNLTRFEPNLTGTFIRVMGAHVPANSRTATVFDLNAHLDYATPTVPQPIRDRAMGDPRCIAWHPSGQKAYIAGMGSNNLIVIDSSGNRTGLAPTIEVGDGPTGLAVQGSMNRLFVLERFRAAVSIVNLTTEKMTKRLPFFDPTPIEIQRGRRHLYNTHDTSGLGQASCGSCHVDGRTDRLSWDLGDPAGSMKLVVGQNLGAGEPLFQAGILPWHPMKGPLATQTLQDIIGKEPMHWRGDKAGLEEFNGAYTGLHGDDNMLSTGQMNDFKDFLATITFPPNPFRQLDNSLSASVNLTGHYTTGVFSIPEGQPLGSGNAVDGLARFRGQLGNNVKCVTCHTLPTGLGPDGEFVGGVFQPFAVGPNGEHHLALVGIDGNTNATMKTPQLRNMQEKVGGDFLEVNSTAGFGFSQDGSADSLAHFLTKPFFGFQSDAEIADIIAFLLAFSGSDLPVGDPLDPSDPPGPPSLDTHAGVGRQTTLIDPTAPLSGQVQLILDMIDVADSGKVGLIIKGTQDGIPRGYSYLGGGVVQADRAVQKVPLLFLLGKARVGSELTLTLVPRTSLTRMGIDRDGDGFYDRDELDQGFDPTDKKSNPLADAVKTGKLPSWPVR